MSSRSNIPDDLDEEIAACREWLGDAPAAAVDEAGMRQLRLAVSESIAADERGLAPLRSLATKWRVGLLFLLAGLLGLAVLLLAPAADLARLQSRHWVVWGLGLAVLFLVVIWQQLRPLQLPATSQRRLVLLLLLGLLGPLLLSLASAPPLQAESLSQAVHGHGFLQRCGQCSLFGLGLAAPLVGAILLFRRRQGLGAAGAGLVAAAGGLLANAVLFAHCELRSSAHVAVGHALVGLLILAGMGLALVVARAVAKP